MEWFEWIKSILPLRAEHVTLKKNITLLFKVNVSDLEICKPKAITRERSFGRTEKLDIVHVFPNGDVRHKPIS